jgi:Reverse transcriptase (RNA-dependent DNA polymerase)
MEFPEGCEKLLKEHHGKKISSKTHCVLLLRALYGLVQAARQWYKKITSIFCKLDFHPSSADPCLYIKKAKGNEPPAYIILYVDDGVIFGTTKIIEQDMESISLVLKVKDLIEVKNFVGCHLVHSTDGNSIHIFQPSLLRTLKILSPNTLIPTESFKLLVLQRLLLCALRNETMYFHPKTKLNIVLVLACYCIWLSTQDLTSQML